jgi:hypothetical protein
MVNRVWMEHFGAGLVRTPSDFGVRSDPPANPELLDWLAVNFMNADGWSIKKLHRQILLSSTWQQASDQVAAGLLALDEAEATAAGDPVVLAQIAVQRQQLLAQQAALQEQQAQLNAAQQQLDESHACRWYRPRTGIWCMETNPAKSVRTSRVWRRCARWARTWRTF